MNANSTKTNSLKHVLFGSLIGTTIDPCNVIALPANFLIIQSAEKFIINSQMFTSSLEKVLPLPCPKQKSTGDK